MEFNTNYDYYSDDLSLNNHIDYIILYKKYLDSLLNDIKNDKINKKLIKQASKIARRFFNSKQYLEESDDIKAYDSGSESEFDFKPMTKIITISDTESDAESDIAIHDASDDDMTQTYKPSNYTKGLLTEYNNSPEFLDLSTSSDYLKQSIKPLTKIEYLQPTYVNKINDKLADDFLNNNLQLNKYYYLKSFNNEQANLFFKACSNY